MRGTTLLVLSDVHGHADRVREVLMRQNERPDAVLFLGDGADDVADVMAEYPDIPYYPVRGNCDFFAVDLPLTRLETFAGFRLFLTHGHVQGVKGGYDHAAAVAYREGADVCLFGHTHERCEHYYPPRDASERPLWVFNPGSLGQPFSTGPSFGILSLRAGQPPLFGFGDLWE